METIYGTHYSKIKDSNISQSFYEQMKVWTDRVLDSHYLTFYIDSLHVKFKSDGKYGNKCFYIIIGLKKDYTSGIIVSINSLKSSQN